MIAYAKPFLKWAGGKRQLLDQIERNLPESIKDTKVINSYIEPFLGGGAVFFFLQNNFTVKNSTISDINEDLMITYKVIQKHPNEMISELEKFQKEYCSLKMEDRKEYYYNKLRTPFNELSVTFKSENKTDWIKKASLLIALNRTCFNGLFRQNSKGEFNVPIGKYENPKICDSENILSVHKVLQNTEIECGSYKGALKKISKKSFIYLDPPYRPLSENGFTKYSKEDFNDKDQKELAREVKRLDKAGHSVLLSNSDPKNTNAKDNFFDDLYSEFDVQRISAKRNISSNGNGRGNITELLIKNY
ncbi:DNA adenine methylase [bacterium]|nr:DNA adenine methylase [bacterium]